MRTSFPRCTFPVEYVHDLHTQNTYWCIYRVHRLFRSADGAVAVGRRPSATRRQLPGCASDYNGPDCKGFMDGSKDANQCCLHWNLFKTGFVRERERRIVSLQPHRADAGLGLLPGQPLTGPKAHTNNGYDVTGE